MSDTSLPELILNVDDTLAARYAKTRILTRAGYRVIEAATGAEALQRVRSDAPDLVLLDTKLPDINGFDVCRSLKSDPGTRMVLVLQTSASYVGSSDKIRGLDGGADNYLFEPIEPDELIANVKALLRLGRVERELREVDRRKDEFLAILAHELRNPLSPIRSAAELLCELDPDAPPAQANARQLILRQATHMVRLIDDLLDVSRISQGKIALHLTEVELAPILAAAVETATPNMQQRGHTLTVSAPEHPVWLSADTVRLAQVLANLLNNAAKFTLPGGQIALSTTVEGEHVLVRVRDNGIGIAPQQLSTIFTLFAQGGHAADRVQDGLGIGLSLARTLVTLHGGDISAASAGVGHGSEFTVRLTRLNRGQTPDAAALQAAPLQGAGKRILLVDDNVDSTEMLSALLAFGGHEVFVAHDGASGIAAALSALPDVVLLDVGLPDMSGLEVATRMREHPQLAATRLVALSGYGSDSDRAAATVNGLDAYLVKPVTFELLSETIARLTA